MDRFIFKSETYRIIGICMEVHRELGYGFSEIVYKDAIEVEAISKGIIVEREKEYVVYYKEKPLTHKFFADFIMFGNIIIEVKAAEDGIADEHVAQTLNYMKVSGCRIGLIINFSKTSLEYKRLIL
ncbi:MAG: GxxExxY protein [Chitinophagaceae bacterium]|nr:GxxExxY protein [Chitinophagaceae bacterium]